MQNSPIYFNNEIVDKRQCEIKKKNILNKQQQSL